MIRCLQIKKVTMCALNEIDALMLQCCARAGKQ